MGRYIKTKIVTSGLIYANDAGNTKSYSGVGTAIKNLVGYGATNTSFNQTFVSSGTTSHFISTGSTSYISNTNVSVSASTGSGFTICMMIKPQILNTVDGWNYWFQQVTSNSSIEFGVISNRSYSEYYPLNQGGGNAGWQIKDNIKIEGQQTFTSVGTTTFTVPVGVTSITAVCVGGGGGAGGGNGSVEGAGGGGGGLSYGSTSVTPGDTLYIRIGAGGAGGRSYNYDNSSSSGDSGSSGQSSYIKTVSHSGTSLLEGGGGGGGLYADANSSGGSSTAGGTSSGTIRTNGGSGGTGGGGSTFRGGGGGGAGGYTGSGGDGGTGGLSVNNGSSGSGGGGGGGGNSSTSISGEVVNPGGGVGIEASGDNGNGGSGGYTLLYLAGGNGGSGGSEGTSSTGNSTKSVGGLYGGGGGSRASATTYNNVRDGGNGGQGAVRIVWGSGRSYPSTNTSNPIPATQYVELNGGVYNGGGSSTDWNFVVCGVTSNYYTFISTNGSNKTLGSSNDWSTAPQINLNKIFGTGTNNYSCLWNNCMIYNRELTNEEIQINFEAFRHKFGI